MYISAQNANLQFILSHHDDNEVFFPDMDTIIKSHIAFQKETATENWNIIQHSEGREVGRGQAQIQSTILVWINVTRY